MGGHGGLNILPQKRWNVYNRDNREKVKRDEEAAAKEEQLRREQSRRAETEVRLDLLRRSKGLQSAGDTSKASTSAPPKAAPKDDKLELEMEKDSRHMNLFGGLSDFDFLSSSGRNKEKKEIKHEEMDKVLKREHKRFKKEEKEPKIITTEDEKHRLGYGLAGKGVNKPWYLTKRDSFEESIGDKSGTIMKESEKNDKKRKKSIEELREERNKRESKEKERERKLFASARNKGFSR